jgi:RIO-like serine/threonine protein kinase
LRAKANIEEYAMELNPQEISLLKCLADEWITSGPPGLVETGVIAKSLDMTIPDTKSTIHTLFVKGLVGTDKFDLYAAYLTPEGFDIARLNHLEGDAGLDA